MMREKQLFSAKKAILRIKPFKAILLLAALFLGLNGWGQQIYFNNFGTTTISGTSYTGSPTLATNLTGGEWTTSASGFTSYSGSSGQALSLSNSSGSPTITLTLTVAAGYKLDISEYNFWRQRSSSGAQNYSITINGKAAGSGTVPTTGAAIGSQTVDNDSITGTFTVVISLSGASGTGTFRLDNFELEGVISALATVPTGLVTGTAGSITEASAIISGNNVGGDGGAAITERGIAYATTTTPTTANNKQVVSGTTGSFNATLTSLSSSTTYYYRAYATNSVGTAYGNQEDFMTNAPAGNSESDIIANGSFSYPTNIDYTSYLVTTGLTTMNSIEVAQFIIRDGGTGNDADALSTVLDNLTLSVGGNGVLRRIAIFDGNTNISEVASSSSAVFTGLNLTAADDADKTFSVRVSFLSSVTDNTQISFTIASATAGAGQSLFAAANAGGASTSTAGDNNRIEVTATDLIFGQNPSNTQAGQVMTPAPTVIAVDGEVNTDLDFTGNVSLSTTSSFDATADTAVNALAGVATFGNLIFDEDGSSRTLTATSSGLNQDVSPIFTILANSLSDIIETAGFVYPTNLAYQNYQGTNLDTSNSIEVAQFSIRDGGASGDADISPTVLNNLTLTVNGHNQLRKIAIYDGFTEVAELAASSSTVFTGLNLTAADDANKTFSVRVSFQSTVTDNTQISFTITSATAGAGQSLFAAANAGGASTSTAGDNNRIEVTATALNFIVPPSNTNVGAVMSPNPSVEVIDIYGNRDNDYSAAIGLSSSGGNMNAVTPVVPTSGVAIFTSITHNASGDSLILIASSGILSNLNSISFDITLVPVELLAWDFDGNLGTEATDTYDSKNANISGTPPSGVISRGSGNNPAANSGRFNANGWNNASLANAITDNDYFEWTISPNSGFEMSLTSIDFNYQRSSTGPQNAAIRSSLDGYTTSIQSFSNLGESDSRSVSLTGFDNLDSSVTFRFYAWGATSSGGTGGFEGDGKDLVINGNIQLATPTPVTYTYNGSWSPSDPSGMATNIDDITINSGTASITADTDCDELSVSLGATLNIDPTVELETAGNLTNNGSIVLNAANTPNGAYAQLKVNGSISGSGMLTLEQYLESGWHNISALGNGSAGILGNIGSNATNGTANTQNLFSWNAANSSWVNVANNSASISAGGGYMGFVGTYGIQNSAGLASWTYPVNSLVSSHQPSLGYSAANGAVNYQGSQNNGWNLVGNPFPCVLRLPESGWGNNVETSVHIMNSEGNYEGSSRLGGNMHIAPGQSFWIRTNNSTNIGFPNLSMGSHCNVGESPEYQKTQSLVADRFYLQVYEPGNTSKGDRFLLGMVAGTQDGLDLSWDATKRLNSPGYPSFFSVSGNYPLAINAIDYGPNNIRPRKLPMRFISTKAYEAYRIELHDSLLTNAYKILLHDHLLNKTHDLNWGPYDFENVPNNEYRFELHIENITTVNNGLLPMGAQGNGISFGNNGGSLVLKATDLAQGAEVNVYNLSGKRIESLRFEAGSSLQTVNMNHWPKGVYLLEILSAEGREMHKLINE